MRRDSRDRAPSTSIIFGAGVLIPLGEYVPRSSSYLIPLFKLLNKKNIQHLTSDKKRRHYWWFEYFSVNNFFEKSNIFQNNSEKLFLGSWHDHFWGNVELDGKNKCDLFGGKWGTEYRFKIFSTKNPIPPDLNPKNWFKGHISPPPIFVVLLGRFFSKINRVHPWVDPH